MTNAKVYRILTFGDSLTEVLSNLPSRVPSMICLPARLRVTISLAFATIRIRLN